MAYISTTSETPRIELESYKPKYGDRTDAKWKGKYTSGEIWCRGIEIEFNPIYASMWEREGYEFTDKNVRYRFQSFEEIVKLLSGDNPEWWKLSDYHDVMFETDYPELREPRSEIDSKNDTNLKTKPFYKNFGCYPTMHIFQLHSDREKIIEELNLVEELCEKNDVDFEFV